MRKKQKRETRAQLLSMQRWIKDESCHEISKNKRNTGYGEEQNPEEYITVVKSESSMTTTFTWLGEMTLSEGFRTLTLRG